MTTTTSSSKGSRFAATYRSALRGQMAFGIVATILYVLLIMLVFFVAMPLHLREGIMSYDQIVEYYDQALRYSSGIYLGGQAHSGFVLVIIMILSFVLAMVQNAYMHNKKMTDFYHSLPVRRETLLGANFAASMTTIFAPLFAVSLFTMAAQLLLYGRYMKFLSLYLLQVAADLFLCVLAGAVIYLFVTCVFTLVGTLFDTFAISAIIAFMPMTVYLIAYALWESMVYGSDADVSNVLMLSPFTFIFQHLVSDSWLWSVLCMAVWVAIGIGLFALARVLYRRRRSELAEQTQPSGVLQIVVKCFGAFCGGCLFLAIFFGGGIVAWIPAVLAGSVLIGIIGEVILSRGFHSLGKNLKWLLLAGGLCLVMTFGIHFDITGYATRVPDAQSVQSVEITYRGRFAQLSSDMPEHIQNKKLHNSTVLTDADSIAAFVEVHRAIVSNPPPKSYEWSSDYDTLTSTHPSNLVQVAYHLKNGRLMTRHYSRVAAQALISLTELENKPDFITGNHIAFELNTANGPQVQSVELSNIFCRPIGVRPLSAGQVGELLTAVRKDMLAEPLDEIKNPSSQAVGYLTFHYSDPPSEDAAQDEYDPQSTGSCHVLVGAGYSNTIAVLTGLDAMALFTVPDDVEWLTIEPLNAGHRIQNTVYVQRPDIAASATVEETGAGDLTVHSDNPGEIAAVREAARNQLLCNGLGGNRVDVVMVSYYKEDIRLGYQLIRLDRLPEALRANTIMQHFPNLANQRTAADPAGRSAPQPTEMSIQVAPAHETLVLY